MVVGAEQELPVVVAQGWPTVAAAFQAVATGTASWQALVSVVDRFGAQVERELARRAVALADELSTVMAGLCWLKRFPNGETLGEPEELVQVAGGLERLRELAKRSR